MVPPMALECVSTGKVVGWECMESIAAITLTWKPGSSFGAPNRMNGNDP